MAGGRDDRTRVVDISPETLERHRLVAALPEHELTDAYRILRTRVLQTMDDKRWNALAIALPIPLVAPITIRQENWPVKYIIPLK